MPRDLDLALIAPVRLAFRRRAPRAIVIAAIALAAFALVLVIDGKDPVRAYRDTLLYVFGNAYGFSELMVRMTPLLMTSLAVALPSRVGLINVGGEGQLYMGAWLATAGALSFPNSRPGCCFR
jgi:general nucleoside transport system permease protein